MKKISQKTKNKQPKNVFSIADSPKFNCIWVAVMPGENHSAIETFPLASNKFGAGGR
jgi:hypothetical protein